VSGRVLYSAGRQVTMVWLVNGLALLCAVGSSWAGVYLAQTYGLQPADGGVLHPLAVRLAMGATVASLGLGFLAGMLVYARCYVVQITAAGDGAVRIRLLWPGLQLQVTAADLVSRQAHAGRSQGRISVNAPWLALHPRDRHLPLIVDEQGQWLAAAPAWFTQRPRPQGQQRPPKRKPQR
jgi:hypothetical protein